MEQDMGDAQDFKIESSEAKEIDNLVDNCKRLLGNLNNATNVVDFYAGKELTFNGRKYQLTITDEEKLARLRVVNDIVENVKDPRDRQPIFNSWLDADQARQGPDAVPTGTWKTPSGEISNRSIYAAAQRDLLAYWGDKQPIH
jgi:hypothetical protein